MAKRVKSVKSAPKIKMLSRKQLKALGGGVSRPGPIDKCAPVSTCCNDGQTGNATTHQCTITI